jgi:glycosyltransferase involved in cell wall biosynthesis
VDLHIFHPVDRSAVRAKFGFTRSTIASVGHLIPRKGNEFIIRALLNLPQVDLAIVGAGPEHAMLVKLANELGLEDRVRFLGVIPHDALAELYSAVDCLVLASSHEGWPNVLLEAMACGTPVAATAVSGSPEIVCSRDAGLLMENRDPKTIAARVGQLLDDLPDRAATRRYAEDYDWDATTAGQLALFEDILNAKPQHRITK